jgi:hypothetical protein
MKMHIRLRCYHFRRPCLHRPGHTAALQTHKRPGGGGLGAAARAHCAPSLTSDTVDTTLCAVPPASSEDDAPDSRSLILAPGSKPGALARQYPTNLGQIRCICVQKHEYERTVVTKFGSRHGGDPLQTRKRCCSGAPRSHCPEGGANLFSVTDSQNKNVSCEMGRICPSYTTLLQNISVTRFA